MVLISPFLLFKKLKNSPLHFVSSTHLDSLHTISSCVSDFPLEIIFLYFPLVKARPWWIPAVFVHVKMASSHPPKILMLNVQVWASNYFVSVLWRYLPHILWISILAIDKSAVSPNAIFFRNWLVSFLWLPGRSFYLWSSASFVTQRLGVDSEKFWKVLSHDLFKYHVSLAESPLSSWGWVAR